MDKGSRKVALFVSVVSLFIGETAMSLEQPEYSVLYNDGDVEYRQYEPYLVSETIVKNSGAYKDAGNEGFRRLFRYITGANQGQQKIAMTIPVAQTQGEKIAMTAPVQQSGSATGWAVRFMLPSQYTLDTAPVPTDARVRIREIPGRLVAVIRYSGRWTERNFANKREELLQAIEAASIEPVGAVQSALYNAPYTPPFMRRNEVLVDVNRMPAAAGEMAAQQLAAF